MLNIQWVDDTGQTLTLDGRNLVELPNEEIYRLYKAYLDTHTIRRTANKYRRLHEQGLIKMPEREKPYDPKKEPLEVASRLAKARHQLGKNALETTIITIPVDHLPYHEKLQEALESDGTLSKATFTAGEHTGFIKNSDNEIEYTDPLKVSRVKFEVDFENEPKWPLVARVESKPLPKRERKPQGSSRKAVIFPDLQIPFEDEKAVEVALQVLKDVKPDKVVILGDLLDLAAYSRFVQEPEWAVGVQEAIVKAHQLLSQIRRLAPEAEISVLEGNHDARLPKDMKNNSAKSLRLKRADKLDGWPVMSVPYLCAFDTLDIEYISGYPANRLWINQNLQVRHGQRVTSRGSTAKLVADDERVSTIFGHTHRMESHMRTYDTYDSGKTNGSYSIGCLCKIDGSVPSTKGGFDLDGKAVKNYEDWQNGFAVVDYVDGDGPFAVQPIYINTFNGYTARYNGKTYGKSE